MALFYILLALGVIFLNIENIPAVFASIFEGAFNPRSVTGGIVGSAFMTLKKGFPAESSQTKPDLVQVPSHTLVQTLRNLSNKVSSEYLKYLPTPLFICTLTALVILCSGVPIAYGEAAGAELTILGFTSTYGNWVSIFTAVSMCCFAFSTIIGWGLYGARCIEFIFSAKIIKPFMIVYSLVAMIGATMDLGLVWNIADTFNGLMAIPNLIALFLLSGTVFKLVNEYKEFD